jgi:hypothetical protein
MTNHPLDQIVATYKLADPKDELPLSARMLCQNVLITGGVGSGKTTSGINPLLREVIRYRAEDPHLKTGLFVFDSKTDGTTERVRMWAKECGREEDIQILGPGGTHGYNPFGENPGAADIEILASKLASLSPENGYGNENAYWTTTSRSGLEAALGAHLIAFGGMELNSALKWLSDLLLCGKTPTTAPAWNKVVEVRDALNTAARDMDPSCYRTIDGYCKMLESWEKLDPKTRGILVTCVQHILGPLLSPRMQEIFPSATRPAIRVADIVDQGKILIFRLNAAADPALSSNVGRLLKADLYSAIQQRRFSTDDDVRLVGLFLDEYPLVATGNQPHFGDVQNLQTMREKRAFVVAATQGFVSLHNAIGKCAWNGLRINLTNQIYFRSNEPEVEELARVILGKHTRSQSLGVSLESEESRNGTVTTESRNDRKLRVEADDWIIQPGDLARLEEHEAFYSLAAGLRSEKPAFFVPDFTAPALDSLPQIQEEMDKSFLKVHQILNPQKVAAEPAEEERRPVQPVPEKADTSKDGDLLFGNIEPSPSQDSVMYEQQIEQLPMCFDSVAVWMDVQVFYNIVEDLNSTTLYGSELSGTSQLLQPMRFADLVKGHVVGEGWQIENFDELAVARSAISGAIDATMKHHKETCKLLQDFRNHHGSKRFLAKLASIARSYYTALGLPVQKSIFEKAKDDAAEMLIEPTEFADFALIRPLLDKMPAFAFNSLTHSFLTAVEGVRGTRKVSGIDSIWFPKGLPALVLSRAPLSSDFALAAALLHISFFTTFTAHLPSNAPTI